MRVNVENGIAVIIDDEWEKENKKPLKYFLVFETKEKDISSEKIERKRPIEDAASLIWLDFKVKCLEVLLFLPKIIKNWINKIEKYLNEIFYYHYSVGGCVGETISMHGIRIDNPTKIVDISKDKPVKQEIGVYIQLEKEEDSE